MSHLRRFARVPGDRRQGRLGAPDDLAGLLVLDAVEGFRHRHPIAPDEALFPLRVGLFSAKKLHQIIVHRLVIVGVLGLPEK
jgi:hypothetical protein